MWSPLRGLLGLGPPPAAATRTVVGPALLAQLDHAHDYADEAAGAARWLDDERQRLRGVARAGGVVVVEGSGGPVVLESEAAVAAWWADRYPRAA